MKNDNPNLEMTMKTETTTWNDPTVSREKGSASRKCDLTEKIENALVENGFDRGFARMAADYVSELPCFIKGTVKALVQFVNDNEYLIRNNY
jgi:hypothetical protein